MPDDDGKELERYKAILRRQEQNWRARFDRALHSDLAAVDIGLVALKTAILVNAGAVIALLAFVGQIWDEGGDTMAALLRGIKPFVYGLVAAGVAAGVAYIYQSIITVREQRALAEVSEGADDLKPQVWVPRLSKWTAVGMIGLVLLSYALFIWGALDIVRALAP